MAQEPPAMRWQVDSSVDPAAFVRYLETAATRPHIQRMKQHSYELLRADVGMRLLDVGCGLGDDARALAALVGPSGAVTGLDASAVMISEARKRTEGTGLPITFEQGDCATLPFADGAFDGVRCERVLQHLSDPHPALREMIRVARVGAWIVVTDADHGMMALNFSDRDLARRVLDARCDAMANGWIGRQLPGLLAQYGLAEIEISPTPSINLSWEATQGDLRRSAAIAARHGAITAAEEQAFLEELAQRAATGQFFLSGVMFTVAGRKP